MSTAFPRGGPGGRPRRRPGGVRVLLAALLACAAPARAAAAGGDTSLPTKPAGDQPRVAILSLSLRGIPADQERRYHDILRAELKRVGYDVVEEKDTRRLLERLGAPPNCFVGPCLQQVGGALGSQRVLVGGVLAQGSNYDVNLTFLETRQGTPVAQATERCEVCTADEGFRAFSRVIASLTGRAPSAGAVGRPPPRVVWRAPSGPAWYEQPGWRIGTLSVGVATLAVGATLLALDGACTGGRTCPRNYTYAGLSLVGAGALVTSAAVAMFLLRGPPRPAPRLAVGAGPKGVALCGTF